ncbi:hypothetical protein BOO91_13020 [Vibrio navarrensis]|uniref:DUF2956 domain-containing protein n=1 Tax=Vibrio navarrensis TaxID=29495 RepID=A0AAJ4I9K6_9VIBR|nr:DUF2956 domain-containing protein [Vibrio navarrensis]MBE3653409.1 hypothetical protein [Vibrio navarrensis]MBE3657049.1 hypothetical protein [Vibrio navarrensis]MBE3661852.1 hypothetical protein [Vibrio navarrensis]QPL52815.1 DUF2956 domain-containing protein [Vibrio navarrensis]
MKRNTLTPSPESQQEALKIARATQKPGQTKEQTKLIAQGIEKGIALYKKQQKERHRQADKARKKQLRLKSDNHTDSAPEDNVEMVDTPKPTTQKLPWVLLAFSWLGFAVYHWIGN